MVDSCRICTACVDGEEQFCDQFPTMTYNSCEKDGTTPSYGGYSTCIVVDQNYVLKVSDRLSAPEVAPLMCAGVTAYSPLRHWRVGADSRVGVIGLGGIGHMAVKLAAAMGADVTVFSHSRRKQADASRFGANNFVDTSEEDLTDLSGRFDLILNTASNSVDVNPFINLLARDGTLVLLGAAELELSFYPAMLYPGRRSLSASMIGGIRETQEMLDFCAIHNIGADIELFAMAQVNEAYKRVADGDIAYRAVLDLATIESDMG
jgi:alcohol dehydrogenase (NADP+)